jgi:hypothetical protein
MISEAINVIVDMFNDSDSDTRKAAINGFVEIAKYSKLDPDFCL